MGGEIEPMPENNASILSHEIQERERQAVRQVMACMTLDGMRLARARVADLLENQSVSDTNTAILTLRGQLLHEEIQRRETGESTLSRFGRSVRTAFGAGQEWHVERLTNIQPSRQRK